ncbi:MAG: signal transduction histidine kinase/CheY-like chemotaxis protein [Planctomycetota bacterium]|jgi:signal transduction histidine kinase/CheY-like chemotaxis protein
MSPAGDVILVGRALERRVSGPFPRPLEELFEDASARKFPCLHEAVRKRSSMLKLRVRGTGVYLRGEGIELTAGGPIAFMGSPLVTSLEDLRECGLQLRDFSVADSTPDLLLSMQATKTALADARELSEKLKNSVVRAEAAVAAKGRFLAIMTHEIRTPMNGLGSMVDLLSDSGLDHHQLELLQTIDDCTTTLGLLLDDALDLSKLEAGAVEVEAVPISLPQLIESVLRMFSASASANDVELKTELNGSLPRSFLGDPTRIRQVLSNLISNAIKFSKGGTVSVCASPGDSGHIRIEVIDTGIGIPEAAAPTLFQPFVQADSSTTRRFGGTGLGLAIARGLARTMGGELALQSSTPAGSVFRFDLGLPIETGSLSSDCSSAVGESANEHDSTAGKSIESLAAGAAPLLSHLRAGLSVLVADDNPVNLLVAERLLRKLGVTSVTAKNGAEAVKAVKEQSFDLILMDLMMPEVGGVEATRQIRDLDVDWSDLPILAFTAGVMQAAREEASAAGMDDFLTKPVRLNTLKEALLRHTRA